MKFNEYQESAARTDQFESDLARSTQLAVRSIASEAVSLIQLYLDSNRVTERDQSLHRRRLVLKLGDILWYLSNFARQVGISLDEIASANLAEVQARFGPHQVVREPPTRLNSVEDLPLLLDVGFVDTKDKKTILVTQLANREFVQIGDRVDDNSRVDDGYRYHDAFHLAYVTHLDWSPVFRALLTRKRKSDEVTDRTEDGARAANLEEAVTAFVFEIARRENYFDKAAQIPTEVLEIAKRLTSGLEVRDRTYLEWEAAFRSGYEIFNHLKAHGSGLVRIDRASRSIKPVQKKDWPREFRVLCNSYQRSKTKKRKSA